VRALQHGQASAAPLSVTLWPRPHDGDPGDEWDSP